MFPDKLFKNILFIANEQSERNTTNELQIIYT